MLILLLAFILSLHTSHTNKSDFLKFHQYQISTPFHDATHYSSISFIERS